MVIVMCQLLVRIGLSSIGFLRRCHLLPGIAKRCAKPPQLLPPGRWYEATSYWVSDGHSGSNDSFRSYSMPVALRTVRNVVHPLSHRACDWCPLTPGLLIRIDGARLDILVESMELGTILHGIHGSEYYSGDGYGSGGDWIRSSSYIELL